MGMTPAIDITAEQRGTVLALLNRHLPDTTTWAYGSRVKWTSRPGSDLDLVVFARPEQSARVAELREAFEESDLPFRVDLFVWDEISESFRKRIKSEYGVLIEADHHDSGHGWRKTTLGDVVELKRGYDLPQRERRYGEIPIVSSSGITDNHFQSKIRGPGVVTGRYGTLGQVFFVPGDFWPLNTTLYVRDFKGNDPRFVSYLLKVFDFSAYSDKAAVPGLNRNHLHQASIHIPENVAEQRAIGHVLGTLDDKIELNRRMNETLEAMAQSLFKSWFLDFDPVRAKIEGRDTGLPRPLANLFPDRLVSSEFGEIPEGWKNKSLGECFSLTMGQSPPGNTYNDHSDGLPFFQGRTDFGFRFPENRKFSTAPTRIAQPEDTLVSVRAPVGDINMAWEQCCIGRGVAALRHKSGSSSFTYYSAWAVQDKIKTYEHTGTVFGAINRRQFEALEMLEPRAELIKAFDAHTGPVDIRIRDNTSESRTLTALRDALLPKLISGEVRLRDAARQVESVA